MNIIIVNIVAFLGAVLSALGMGGGGILIMYLTVVAGMDQLAAQGINLAFFVPIAIIALVFHIKNKLIDFKKALVLILLGSAGVFLGAKTAMSMDREVLSKCFGGLLLFMSIKEFWPKKKNNLKAE